MTTKELAESFMSGMFTTRETPKEAFDYAMDLARASENPAAVTTAVMVVVNTLMNEIIKNEEGWNHEA